MKAIALLGLDRVIVATVQVFFIQAPFSKTCADLVAWGIWGGRVADNLHDIALLTRTGLAVGTKHATSADLPIDESLEQLSRTLFARITECVINHETDYWPGYYDKLCATVCQVVARSDLSSDSKSVLTRRLIEHVVELQRWWPRLSPR
jgi:hypothetical protein